MTESSPHPIAAFVCPFCGGATPDQPRCAQCAGPLDPLSRQATQNAMGPWFVRDEQQPFRPGCSYETILTMVSRGKITSDTILRGPSTSQFWYPAKRVPGVAHRLGVCHSCQQAVGSESECPNCGAVFHADPDRQFLGLMPVRSLPGAALHSSESHRPTEPVSESPTPASSFAPLASGTVRTPERASAWSARMESEIAVLRRRNWMLAGVTGACALVALGLTWVLASGLGEGRTISAAPSGDSVPAQNKGVIESPPAEKPGSLLPQANPSGAEKAESPPAEEQKSVPASPAQPAPNSENPPSPNPGNAPESPVKVSEELAPLRSTRWP